MIGFNNAIHMYKSISDDDDTTVAEKEVADESDRAGNGEFEKMTAGCKGTILNLFHTVGHLIARLLKCKATELQDLAILGIADAIFVHIEWFIEVVVLFFAFLNVIKVSGRSAIDSLHDRLQTDRIKV